MAKLNEVVGGILQDITSAKVIADRHSATIYKEYEKDSILKFFPIPKLEINSIDLELKFIVNKVGGSGTETDVSIEFEKIKSVSEICISSAKINLSISNLTQAKLLQTYDKSQTEI